MGLSARSFASIDGQQAVGGSVADLQGYNGLACTNCADNWGNSRTFHCKACLHSPAINTFLIFLTYLASFLVCCWIIRSSLATAHQIGTEQANEFEEVSDMMKVGQQQTHCYLGKTSNLLNACASA